MVLKKMVKGGKGAKKLVDKIKHPPYLTTYIGAGQAMPAPPLGPQLGQMSIDAANAEKTNTKVPKTIQWIQMETESGKLEPNKPQTETGGETETLSQIETETRGYSGLEAWNITDLRAPPYVTVKTANSAVPSEMLKRCVFSLDKVVSNLEKPDLQHTEEFLLNRLIYKFQNNFRRERFLHFLIRIQKCLKKYKGINLLKMTKDCKESLSELSGLHIYLPSSQNIRYILARLQGSCAVLGQATNYCVQVYIHAYRQLKAGMFIHNMLVVSALVSRMRMLCNNAIRDLCACYKELRTLLSCLKATDEPCEPLPEQLDSWLCVKGFSTEVSSSYQKLMSKSDKSLNDLLERFTDEVVEKSCERPPQQHHESCTSYELDYMAVQESSINKLDISGELSQKSADKKGVDMDIDFRGRSKKSSADLGNLEEDLGECVSRSQKVALRTEKSGKLKKKKKGKSFGNHDSLGQVSVIRKSKKLKRSSITEISSHELTENTIEITEELPSLEQVSVRKKKRKKLKRSDVIEISPNESMEKKIQIPGEINFLESVGRKKRKKLKRSNSSKMSEKELTESKIGSPERNSGSSEEDSVKRRKLKKLKRLKNTEISPHKLLTRKKQSKQESSINSVVSEEKIKKKANIKLKQLISSGVFEGEISNKKNIKKLKKMLVEEFFKKELLKIRKNSGS